MTRRRALWGVAAMTMAVFTMAERAEAQVPQPTVHEVPLRVEDGRLVVRARATDGTELDFVLGLGSTRLSAAGARALGPDRSVTLGGAELSLAGATEDGDDTVFYDGSPAGSRIAGVLGGQSLSDYDVLIDAPTERLLLKQVGRTMRWEGVELTSAVQLQVLHDYLIRTQVEVNGELFFAHLELSPATMLISGVVAERSGVNGRKADFRMGYASFPERATSVSTHPYLAGWGGDDVGVVFIGAPVAYDCVIAISWAHAQMRTCPR